MRECTETEAQTKSVKPLWKWTKRILLVLAGLILTVAIVVGISILVCRSSLAVHSYDVRIDGIKQPFTAVLLSDLHNLSYGEGNADLLEKVRAQKPDVIFCDGDMIDRTAGDADVEHYCVLLTALKQIAPVYVSYGNHEKSYMNSGGKDLTPLIEETGVVLLDEACAVAEIAENRICIGGTLGHLYLFGRTREEYRSSPEFRLMQEMEASGLPTIVLAHKPDTIIFCKAYKDWDIDLFLSGHTHGGVIRIPFVGGLYAPMQGWFPDEDMGYYNYGRVQLVISSGMAPYGKVPRIFNRPEVCVLHISG